MARHLHLIGMGAAEEHAAAQEIHRRYRLAPEQRPKHQQLPGLVDRQGQHDPAAVPGRAQRLPGRRSIRNFTVLPVIASLSLMLRQLSSASQKPPNNVHELWSLADLQK